MNRLVLIDGNAILHRAYHALPALTAPDGSLVNAVYGFASMLLKIHENLKPTHMAVAFDRPKPTFRKELFKGYQAKRPKMDEELVGQIERVHELVAAFGIPVFEKDGYEADDVIGTLSRKAKGIDQVIIVTGDRDILQLVVDEKVLVYMPTKGLSEAKLYGEKEVTERMGVPPKLVVDLKALAGDASDNYPGVPGIGPKTAVELLKTYKSLKGIYRNLKELKEKKTKMSAGIIQKLIAGEENAMLGEKLATIDTNVPLSVNLVPVASFDTPVARVFLDTLHFHSLLKKLKGGEPSDTKEEKPKQPKKKLGEQQELF